jgi:hypothetical protein
MAGYDAFISYSHAKDKTLASALQSVLQKIGKPWYARRSLRVFRDDASLAATPRLWPALERALGQSRFLILMASPEAAASPWVAREVEFWLAHKSIDTLLLALTAGQLEWDNAANDFAWNEATPLPAVLRGKFPAEPKWVEMHAFRRRLSRSGVRFAEVSASLAAAVHGLPKEDLLSKEVWQQRRALMLASATAGVMLVLGVTSAWYWHSAVEAHRLATEQRDYAQANQENSERAILAASRTANTLIVDIAKEIRARPGLPPDLVRKLLYRAQYLQDQLTQTVEQTPALLRGSLLALNEIAAALAAHGDLDGAIGVAQRCVAIAQRLTAAGPDIDGQRELAASLERLGELLIAAGRGEEALKAYAAAVDILEKLAAANPGDPQLQQHLAASRQRIASATAPRLR